MTYRLYKYGMGGNVDVVAITLHAFFYKYIASPGMFRELFGFLFHDSSQVHCGSFNKRFIKLLIVLILAFQYQT